MTTRVRPSIRRAARIVLPVLILIAAWQVWDNIETRRLAAAFSVMRPLAEAQPRPGLAGDRDSAGRFYAAAALAAIQEDRSALPQESLPNLVLRLRNALQQNVDVAPADTTRADAVLARNELTLRLLDRAASLPFDGFHPGSDFNYRWSGTWTAERLAALATLDALRRRDAAAAATALASRLQLLRALNADALNSLMLADALANQSADLSLLLALPGLEGRDLQPLNRAFATVVHDDDLTRIIAGYATSRYDFVQTVSGARSWQYGHLGVPLRPLLAHRVVATLRTCADAVAIARRPWPARLTAMKELRDRSSIVGNVFLPYAWWAVAEQVQQVTRSIAIGVAASRAASLALAADAYRRNSGHVPGTLAELGLDREATLDPFSGESLRYRPSEAGFVVYSVGENGRDDGGALEEQLARGVMPGRGQRVDIGVKVSYAALAPVLK